MPNVNFNILLTSAGRRVALVRRFQQSLRDLGISGSVYAADCSPQSAAYHAADEGIIVPRVTSEDYISTLQKICEEKQIRMVVPTIDTELEILAREKANFQEKGIELVVSSIETIATTRNKQKTYEHFLQNNILTPKVYSEKELKSSLKFPVFLKPSSGSRSIGSRMIASQEALEYWLPRTENPIVMDYIEGLEYTIDVYVDRSGHPQVAVPRLREEVRDGEISKGITKDDPKLIEAALAVANSLPGSRGVLTTQCRVDASGAPYFFEVNARFGGGAPLSIQAGADFPKWLIQESLKIPVTDYSFKPGLRMLRFDDAIWSQT